MPHHPDSQSKAFPDLRTIIPGDFPDHWNPPQKHTTEIFVLQIEPFVNVQYRKERRPNIVRQHGKHQQDSSVRNIDPFQQHEGQGQRNQVVQEDDQARLCQEDGQRASRQHPLLYSDLLLVRLLVLLLPPQQLHALPRQRQP